MTEMEKTFLTRMIAWTALLLIFALPSPAQWVNYKTPGIPRPPDGKPNLSAPAPRTADGKPDISGIWRVNGYQYNIGKDLKTGEILMLPEAQAIYNERREINSFDNPWARCFPGGVPRAFLYPDPFKILHMFLLNGTA